MKPETKAKHHSLFDMAYHGAEAIPNHLYRDAVKEVVKIARTQPELLEAAKKALKEIENNDDYNNGNQRIGDVVFDLSQAIAKAEGKP